VHGISSELIGGLNGTEKCGNIIDAALSIYAASGSAGDPSGHGGTSQLLAHRRRAQKAYEFRQSVSASAYRG